MSKTEKNGLKDKNHMTIFFSRYEKAFDKIQYLLVIKAQKRLGIEGTYVSAFIYFYSIHSASDLS